MASKIERAKVKAKWAKKVLSSESFIIITDGQSGLFSEIVSPKRIETAEDVALQRAAVSRLMGILKDVDKELQATAKDMLSVGKRRKPTARRATKTNTKKAATK